MTLQMKHRGKTISVEMPEMERLKKLGFSEEEIEARVVEILDKKIPEVEVTEKPVIYSQLLFSYSNNISLYDKDGKPIYTSDFFWNYYKWEELHEVTKKYGYSNAQFKDRYRNSKNVISLGALLIYDYDDGITLDKMLTHIESLEVSAYLSTTLSHQKEKKGVTCDRFRLIFQLEKPIGGDISTSNMEEILSEVAKALELDMGYDTACKTIERYYAPNPNQEHWYLQGQTLDISEIINETKKEKIKPIPNQTPRLPIHYSNSGLPLKEMRQYVRDHISYDEVVSELTAKGLDVNNRGDIFLDRKKVGNVHPKTRFIANWAESEHLDIIGVLDKFYGECYKENTKRLYERLR